MGNDENIKEFTQQEVVNDEFLNVFIGKNARKILNRKFNIAAFFFGFFWLGYKKCYLFSLLFYLMVCLFNIIQDKAFAILSFIVISMLFACIANPLYIWNSKKKISKIMKENAKATKEELYVLLAQKGGSSIIGSLLMFLITVMPSLINNVINTFNDLYFRVGVNEIIIFILVGIGLYPVCNYLIKYSNNNKLDNFLIENKDIVKKENVEMLWKKEETKIKKIGIYSVVLLTWVSIFSIVCVFIAINELYGGGYMFNAYEM